MAARRWPGEPEGRQPVHTVYGGAHLFRADTARRLGNHRARPRRRSTRRTRPPWPRRSDLLESGAGARGADAGINARVVAKLPREPVEDFRIDFEDGYGQRPTPRKTATRDRRGARWRPGCGGDAAAVHRHPHQADVEGAARAQPADARLFVGALAATGGALPAEFRGHDPKVIGPGQVAAVAGACERSSRRSTRRRSDRASSS